MKRGFLSLFILLAACFVSCSQNSTPPGSSTKASDGTDSGLNGKGTSYHAVVELFTVNPSWPHLQQVQQAVSALTEKELGIQLEFLPVNLNAQRDPYFVIEDMVTSGRQLDIVDFSLVTDQTSYMSIKGCQLMMKMVDLQMYEAFLNDAFTLLGDELIIASLFEGKLIALPRQFERTRRYGMALRTDWLNEAGYRQEDLVTGDYEQLTAIFKAVQMNHPDKVMCPDILPTLPGESLHHTDYLIPSHFADAFRDDGFGVLDDYGSTWEVTNYYESEYYLNTTRIMIEWYKAGYFKSLMDYNDWNVNAVKNGDAFGCCMLLRPDSQKTASKTFSHDMTLFSFKEDMLEAPSKLGYGIPSTAGDYIQAARLLNFIYTNRAFNDVINWGVEGLDWVEKGDNIAAYPEGVTPESCGYHNDLGWIYPNQRLAHVWEGTSSDYFNKTVIDAEQAAHKSVAYGFIFDNSGGSSYSEQQAGITPIWDTIQALKGIRDEYWVTLSKLSPDDDPGLEAMISDYNQKLYAIGLGDLMQEKQKQLDKWRGRVD